MQTIIPRITASRMNAKNTNHNMILNPKSIFANIFIFK